MLVAPCTAFHRPGTTQPRNVVTRMVHTRCCRCCCCRGSCVRPIDGTVAVGAPIHTPHLRCYECCCHDGEATTCYAQCPS